MSLDLDGLEQALDMLLSAIIEEDRKAREAPAETLVAEVVTAVSMERVGRMTRLDLDVADIERGPVRAACRQAVRRIGEHLFKVLGTTSAMSGFAERVAGWKPRQYGMRVSIIDHAWDGIGSGADRWCA